MEDNELTTHQPETIVPEVQAPETDVLTPKPEVQPDGMEVSENMMLSFRTTGQWLNIIVWLQIISIACTTIAALCMLAMPQMFISALSKVMPILTLPNVLTTEFINTIAALIIIVTAALTWPLTMMWNCKKALLGAVGNMSDSQLEEACYSLWQSARRILLTYLVAMPVIIICFTIAMTLVIK